MTSAVMGRIREKTRRLAARVLPEKKRRDVSPLPPVVLFHGLNMPNSSMRPLAWRMERLYNRKTIIARFSSWRGDIPDCAAAAARQLNDMGVREFDAITHSMGGVVLRWAMNHCDMPRLRRAVLVAPPSSGSWLASMLHRRTGPVFTALYGQAGLQLRSGSEGVSPLAGSLHGAEVGIIAGGSGTPRGKRNIFRIAGDNDGIVAVEETILPGMRDFVLLNLDHFFLLLSSQTAHMANLFLEHGVFRPRMAVDDHEEMLARDNV